MIKSKKRKNTNNHKASIAIRKQIEKYKEHIPLFALPDWMPASAKEIIKNIDSMMIPGIAQLLAVADLTPTTDNKDIKKRLRSFKNQAMGLIRYRKNLKPAFESEDLKGFWLDLDKRSLGICADFTGHLFHVENTLDGAKNLIAKHNDEIRVGKMMITQATRLKNVMNNYHTLFYGHFIGKGFVDLQEKLESFIPETEAAIKKLEAMNDYSCEYWPVTREMSGKHALPLFFLRKNYLFFKKNLKKPLHKKNAEIVNVMFGTTYSDTDVAKAIAPVKNLKTDE